jgi:hypothetical protein
LDKSIEEANAVYLASKEEWRWVWIQLPQCWMLHVVCVYLFYRSADFLFFLTLWSPIIPRVSSFDFSFCISILELKVVNSTN